MWGRTKSTLLIVANAASTPALRPTFVEPERVRTIDVGSDCIAAARDAGPALIVEDLATDGEAARCLDVCRVLKTDPATRAIPLVAVVERDREAYAREAHADAVLAKPIVPSEYFGVVGRFVRLPRRRTPRFPLNLRFCFELEGRRAQAFSRDVSSIGAFLKTDLVPVSERMLELHFRIPGDARELTCLGAVRRSMSDERPNDGATGFAVEFVDLADDDRKRLEAFLSGTPRRGRARG